MRSRIFFLMMLVVSIWACEDPTTLAVSSLFNNNNLQTAYADTFSVVTSTIQLDTFITNGTGSILLGNYHDAKLGDVNTSTYFQISYSNSFLPDKRSTFDSIELVLPYNHQYIGDTTVPVTLKVYQLSEKIILETLPSGVDGKYSAFNISFSAAKYNTSTVDYFSIPIVSSTVNFHPHKDSLFIKLPNSLGANWFRLAQFDSGQLFSNSTNFLASYFYGLHIDTDRSTAAAVVGFTSAKVKIRLHYKAYKGDFLTKTFTDFTITNPNLTQFNHIDFDRSTGTVDPLKTAQVLKPIASSKTNHELFIQQGTGLVARLDFPSVKSFFAINNNISVNAAYLEIYPLRASYPTNLPPPSALYLYPTDNSNLPLSPTVSGGSANIQYDREFGLNTVYRFNFYPFLISQLTLKNNNYTIPVILGPSSQGDKILRLYFGDQFHAETKIRLKIYYSYTLN